MLLSGRVGASYAATLHSLYIYCTMPKRKATSQISGLMGSDDEDLMQLKETQPQAEPPAKKRRGRPRTSEDVTETKPTKPTTRAKKQQAAAAEPEAPAEKKPTRRGRPKGSGRATQASEPPAPAEIEEMEDTDTQDQENEDPVDAKPTKKPSKTTKAKAAPAATRTRGPARHGGARKPQLDEEFEYTPSHGRQTSVPEENEPETSPVSRAAARGRQDAEVEETQQTAELQAPVIEASRLPELARRSVSPQKHRAFRPSLLRNPQDSPFKRKLADSEQGGDPELRRRLGELTKKHDALEIRYRNLREIGVVEANTNLEKLRKQSETITTGTSYITTCRDTPSKGANLPLQRRMSWLLLSEPS